MITPERTNFFHFFSLQEEKLCGVSQNQPKRANLECFFERGRGVQREVGCESYIEDEKVIGVFKELAQENKPSKSY